MADQIKVRAKEGATLPHASPQRGFVGYARVTDDSAQEGDHVVPGGARYRPIQGGELVPNTVHYRRALARGDLEEVSEETAQESSSPERESQERLADDEPQEAPAAESTLPNALRTHTHRKG